MRFLDRVFILTASLFQPASCRDEGLLWSFCLLRCHLSSVCLVGVILYEHKAELFASVYCAACLVPSVFVDYNCLDIFNYLPPSSAAR